jgi:hypothetical protein
MASETAPGDLGLEVPQLLDALAREASRQVGLVEARLCERIVDRRFGELAVDAFSEQLRTERATSFRSQPKPIADVREGEGPVIQVAELAAAPERRGGSEWRVAGPEQPPL